MSEPPTPRVVPPPRTACSGPRPLPYAAELPRGGVRVRDAVERDLDFIDGLQKQHTKAVGWMPSAQLAGHLRQGHVLIAETISGAGGWDSDASRPPSTPDDTHATLGQPSPLHTSFSPAPPVPVGYCIGVDRYFKREDVGIIYQMNIDPVRQRGLIGATLLQAMFDRSPYGVRLFCCWCAQDLAANRFWEAMGFVPLAFRTGSRRRARTHIFWQKRIRKGDTGDPAAGGTPWLYPSQTGAGAIREDRIVLPIPPGVHWSDAKPRVLPGMAGLFDEITSVRAAEQAEAKRLKGPQDKEARARRRSARRAAQQDAEARVSTVAAGGLRFGSSDKATPKPKVKKKKVPTKNHPRLVAASRELRDRWLERIAAEPSLLESSADESAGTKYRVCRRSESRPHTQTAETLGPLADVPSKVAADPVRRLTAA